jgi:hypothetical protein
LILFLVATGAGLYEQCRLESKQAADDRALGICAHRISFPANAGWLVRIMKSLYLVVTDLSAFAVGNASHFVISNAPNSKSYGSLAAIAKQSFTRNAQGKAD